MSWNEIYKTLTSGRTELEIGFFIVFYFLANAVKELEGIHDTLRKRLPPLRDAKSEF
jgi:hypothetical protein